MIPTASRPTADDLAHASDVVAKYLTPTPSATISIRSRTVGVKLESLQVTGAFKIRGALAALSAAQAHGKDVAVITASAGNHGLGIAHAAQVLGVRATVVVPVNASAVKVEKLKKYDIELLQYGKNFDEAQDHAKELASRSGLAFVSAFNNANVIAGQATAFAEMLDQLPGLEHLVVPVGGGGLLSGLLAVLDQRGITEMKITGVQSEESAAMYHVLRGSTMSQVQHRPTIADGLAGGGDDDAVTNEIIREHHVPIVLVPERFIRSAVREAVDVNGLVMEGSSSTAYAAIAQQLVDDTTSKIGFIASGRNIAHDLLVQLLQEPLL